MLSSAILSTRGYRDALVLGFFLMAAGVTGLNSGSQYIALLATALYGFGFGIVIPATNLCIAEISGARRAAALNLVNMAWGVGAIACPILLLAGLRADRYTAVLLSIAASALLLSIFFVGMKFEGLSPKSPSDATAEQKITPAHPIHVPVALALLFYLYIGTENGYLRLGSRAGPSSGHGKCLRSHADVFLGRAIIWPRHLRVDSHEE